MERAANFARAENRENIASRERVQQSENRAPDTSELHRAAKAAAVTVPAKNEVRLLEIEKILEGDDPSLAKYYSGLSETGKEKFRLQGEALCQAILRELDRELRTPERKGLRALMHEVMTALIPTRDVRFWTMDQVEQWLTRNGVSKAFAEQHAEIAMQQFATLLKSERERAQLSS